MPLHSLIPVRFFYNYKKEWIKDLPPYLLLAFLVVLKFWNFLLSPDRLYWAGDFLESTHMRDYFYWSLKQGEWFLWNSRIGGGMPYPGTEFGTFYPIDLLQGLLFSSFFDPQRLAWVHAFHFWLGGFFTYLYTRQIGFYRVSALVSSICFLLGGTLLGHAGHRNVIQGFIWLPLILYFLDKALVRRKAFPAVLAGCLLAVSFYASHTQFFYYILLFLAFYFLFRIYLGFREKNIKGLRGDIYYFSLTAVFCLGLSAVQLLPMLVTSLNTFHGTQPFDWQALFHFPLFNLIHFLIPDYMRWAATDFGEQYGYIGVLPLVLAFWGVTQSKDRRVRFLAIVIVFAFTASLGRLTPFYKFLFDFLPGLSQFRVPARFNALIIFPLALLAGFGFQQFLDNLTHGRGDRFKISLKGVLYISLGAGLGIFLYLQFYYLPVLASQGHLASPPWEVLRKGFLWFLLLCVGAYLLVSLLIRKRGMILTQGAVALLISFDLLVLGRIDGGYLKTNPVDTPLQAQKDLEEMVKEPQPFRTNNFRGLINLLYRSRQGIAVFDVENLWGYVGTVVPREYLEIYILSEKNPMLLDLLNVKFVSGSRPKTGNGLSIWEIGGNFQDKSLELKDSSRITHLSLISFLSHSTSVKQGAELARVVLEMKNGSRQIIPIRAGLETAEWAVDRPGQECLHQKAPIAETWEMAGEGYQGHAYLMERVFPSPSKVSRIRLEYIHGQGTLLIKKILINHRDLEEFLRERFQELSPNFYKNRYCLPRVFMIARARAVSEEAELIKQMEQLDPRETVLVAQLPSNYRPPLESGFSEQEAEIVLYSHEKIHIRTNCREDKFLVLSETYSPFWKARIDNNSVPILKVNYGLRGLYVAKGVHHIEFTFHFPPFYYGLLVSLISLAGVLLFFIGTRISNKRAKTSEKESVHAQI
ncbi:MAG: YfhO family protein [Thermodesulfobacteriota bacterium]